MAIAGWAVSSKTEQSSIHIGVLDGLGELRLYREEEIIANDTQHFFVIIDIRV